MKLQSDFRDYFRYTSLSVLGILGGNTWLDVPCVNFYMT